MKNINSRRRSAVFSLLLALSFLMPARAVFCEAADEEGLTIPFRMVDHMIVVELSLNGTEKVDLFVDTGLGSKCVILFDPAAGKRLGLEYIGQVPLGGGGAEPLKRADICPEVSVSYAGKEIMKTQAWIMTDGVIFRHWPGDGLIGASLFDYTVEIDFEKSIIRLHPGIGGADVSKAEEFPLAFTCGIPVITGRTVMGGEAVALDFIVDTGAFVPFILFTYSDPRIRAPEGAVRLFDEGMNGDMEYLCARSGPFTVGRFEFGNPVTAFIDREAMGSAAVLGQNGFFGLETLRKFRVVFDYAGKKLYLEPGKDFGREYSFNMAGLVLKTRPDGRPVVHYVAKDSPAFMKQIVKGDIIAEIDGRDTKNMSFEEIYQAFINKGADIGVKIMRGKEILHVDLKLEFVI